MNTHFSKKLLAMILAVLMIGSACGTAATPSPAVSAEPSQTASETTEPEGTESEPVESEAANSEEVEADPASAAERHLRLTLLPIDAPATFNPHTNDKQYDLHKLWNANLYTRIADKETGWTKYVPEIASGQPVQLDEEGLVWEVKLTEGNVFDDGTPIDANTFVYSFQMRNHPGLLNRNNSGDSIVGANAYFAGEIPFEEVTGFVATDDYTLQITYTADYAPVDGAADVMLDFGDFNGAVHPEIYQASLNADETEATYGTSLDQFCASGPYRIVEYIDGQYLEIEKRENYTAEVGSAFTADRISFRITGDENAMMMMYETGEIDLVSASGEQYDEYPDLYYYNSGYVYGIFLNPFSETNPILQDKNFRLAMYWGIDREKIVNAAFPTFDPLARMYPKHTRIKDVNDKTVKYLYPDTPYAQGIEIDGHPLTESGYDEALALEYFEKAYASNGGAPININVQYSDASESNTLWAEAIQEHYQNLFGADRFTISLVSVPDQVALEAIQRKNMDYEVVAARRVYQIIDGEPWDNTNWISDGHPAAYDTQYCVLTPDAQAQFTEWYDRAKSGEYQRDQEGRNQTSADVEELLLNEATFIPVYNDRNRLMISPWLQSVLPAGHPDIYSGQYFYEWDDAMYAEAAANFPQ